MTPPSAPRTDRRRGPVGAPVGAAVVAAALLATGCAVPTGKYSLIGDPSPIPGQPTAPPPTSPTTSPPTVPPTTAAPTTTTIAPQPPRPYAVGTTMLDLTDPTRMTGSQPGRHLPTYVFYPAVGASGPSDIASATPLYHSWPLVIFAHGYDVTPLTYEALLHYLASAGFVVMAPSFPLETAGGPLDEGDLSNEPGDIDFVITQALTANTGGGLLDGMIDPNRIALVGHSDGAEAVLGAAYEPGLAANKAGPVVAISGAGVLTNGQLPAGVGHHELMIIQGTADTTNPPGNGDNLFAAAASPKAYLRLLGAGHLPPVVDANQWRPVVEMSIVDWLDEWLGGLYGGSATARLAHDGNIAGVSQVRLG